MRAVMLRFGDRELALVYKQGRGWIPEAPGWRLSLFSVGIPAAVPGFVVDKCERGRVSRVGGTATYMLRDIEVPVNAVMCRNGEVIEVKPPAVLRISRLTVMYAGGVSVSATDARIEWNGKVYKHENISGTGVVCTGTYHPHVNPENDVCQELARIAREVLRVLATPNAGSPYHDGFATYYCSMVRGGRSHD